MLMPGTLRKPTRAFLRRFRGLQNDGSHDSHLQVPTASGYEGSSKIQHLSVLGVPAKSGDVRETLLDEMMEEVEILEQEGGFQAWLVVFGSFMGLIPVFGIFNSLGAIESYISKHQLASQSSSVVSWIFSIYLSLTFASCIIAGGYFDRNGGRDPLCAGTLMFTGAIVATADCKSVWQFIVAFSVLGGVSSGILMTPLVSCVATWFARKRGFATSIATIGGSVGGVIFPVMLRSLYSKIGFAWALRVLALICFSCLACSIVLAREKQKPESTPFLNKTEAFKWYIRSSLNWRYFFDWKFLFAALGMGFAENSLSASSTYLASYSIARGNSEKISYALIATTNAVGVLGRYASGYVADKWTGRFNLVILTVSLASIFNLMMWLPFGGNLTVLWSYSICYGFVTGSILSLPSVCIGQISRTIDFGKRYSSAYFLEAIMTIPVIPVGGTIIGTGEISNYNKFIVYSSMMMIAASVCFSISRFICTGFRICKF